MTDTDCRKCKAPMKPWPKAKGSHAINTVPVTTTAYRCDCGHWNNLKRRKEFKAQRAAAWAEQTEAL